MEEKDLLAVEPLEKVMLDGPDKFTYASSLLTDDEKEQLRLALLSNIDVFAWSHLIWSELIKRWPLIN